MFCVEIMMRLMAWCYVSILAQRRVIYMAKPFCDDLEGVWEDWNLHNLWVFAVQHIWNFNLDCFILSLCKLVSVGDLLRMTVSTPCRATLVLVASAGLDNDRSVICKTSRGVMDDVLVHERQQIGQCHHTSHKPCDCTSILYDINRSEF